VQREERRATDLVRSPKYGSYTRIFIPLCCMEHIRGRYGIIATAPPGNSHHTMAVPQLSLAHPVTLR